MPTTYSILLRIHVSPENIFMYSRHGQVSVKLPLALDTCNSSDREDVSLPNTLGESIVAEPVIDKVFSMSLHGLQSARF